MPLDPSEVETPAELTLRGNNGAKRLVLHGEPVSESLMMSSDTVAHDRVGILACDCHPGEASVILHTVGMEKAAQGFVRQYLHRADSKGGAVIPRPLAELRHVAVVSEVLHFLFLHLGDVEEDGEVSDETGLVTGDGRNGWDTLARAPAVLCGGSTRERADPVECHIWPRKGVCQWCRDSIQEQLSGPLA